MVEILKEPVFVELRGTAYNVMVQHPDKFSNFKVDLVLEGAELDKALEYQEKYGLKVKDSLTYMSDGKVQTKEGQNVTIKYKNDGKFPRDFIPAKDDSGNTIKDLISHGADITARFKIYGYSGGKKNGFEYPGGNGFQLEAVRVHSYEPYNKENAA